MAENIAGRLFWAPEFHGERICFVERGCRHRQPDDDSGPLVEFPRGKNEQRMDILHLPAGLKIAIDPDHVATVGTPGLARGHQITSRPTRAVAMTSPPCRAGSNAASFCASVNLGSPRGLTSTLESCAETSTGWPGFSRAERATAAGIRTARLLPHCCSVSVALFDMFASSMYKQV